MEKTFIARLMPVALSLSALFLAGCHEDAATHSTAPPSAVPLAAMVIPVCVNGECLVLDQKGSVLVNGDNTYAVALSVPLNSTFIYAEDGQWNVANADGTQVIKPAFTEGLRLLTPGFFGFERDGKWGVMDQQGNEVQPPAYDDIYPGGGTAQGQYIVYGLDDKYGLLSAEGHVITAPLFDSLLTHQDSALAGGWVSAERDGQNWAINLQTRELKSVGFDKFVEYANEHFVVSQGRKKGLADASNTLLTELKYDWMGVPGDGLVAFKENFDSLCGYLDFKGQVAIAPSYDACEVFGHKGALVKAVGDDGKKGKYGFLARSGEWLIQPSFDSAEPAVHSPLGMLTSVPGFTQTGNLQNMFTVYFGLFDTDKGVELFKPEYAQIGVLTPDRFVFAKPDSPKKTITFLGSANQLATLGLMDAKGKVLIEPGQYVALTLDKSGRFIRAWTDTSRLATTALYDLNGKLLVPAHWQEVVIDEQRGALFAYELEGTPSDETRSLRALYSLDGTPGFETRTVGCDVQQVIDGSGKVLWPTDPEHLCGESDDAAETQQQG